MPVLLRAITVILCLGSALSGQSSLRAWGVDGYFDTDSRNGPASFVSANVLQTVVLRANGALFVQGQNDGEVCEAPPAPAGLVYVTSEVGHEFGVGELSNGELVLWGGLNYWPALALPAVPVGVTFSSYAVGTNHALFLRSDGVVVSIGENGWGQCTVPAFPNGLSVANVFAGPLVSGAILSDGSLWCWGANNWGQTSVPPLPSGLSYATVSLGAYHSLAIRSDGSMVAFGAGVWGLNTVPSTPAGVTWDHCAVGSAFSVAVRSDGVIHAWGDNTYGQTVVPQSTSSPVVQLDAAAFHTVARLADGTVQVWGYNRFFACDLHRLPGTWQGNPTARYVDMAVGSMHCVALLSDGTSVGFGANPDGRTDIPVLPAGMSYVKLKASLWRSAAIRSDGQLVMFGNAGSWSVVPPLPAGVSYEDAALSTGHTVALRTDGAVVAFGSSASGATAIPALPAGLVYKAVDALTLRTLLLRSDDVLFSLGDFGPYPPPTVEPGVHFTGIAASRHYDAALRSDGIALTWGSKGIGFSEPDPLPWGVYYVEVEGGVHWTALRRSDGQVVMAGKQGAVNVPPLLPGTSYVQLDGVGSPIGGRVGVSSTYIGFGHGCAGTLGPARIVPADTPKIGREFGVNVFDLPADIAILAMSFVPQPAPVSLVGLGMPGCDWFVGLDAIAILVGQDGVAGHAIPIPDVESLVGVGFQHQALVLDLAAPNTFGAVVSDAMVGVVGHR